MDKDRDVEIYKMQVDTLGVDSADFIMSDATFIRIQVIIRGKIKVIPQDLLNDIAKLIREYDLKKNKA